MTDLFLISFTPTLVMGAVLIYFLAVWTSNMPFWLFVVLFSIVNLLPAALLSAVLFLNFWEALGLVLAVRLFFLGSGTAAASQESPKARR